MARDEIVEHCWTLPHGLKLGLRVRDSDGEVVLFIVSAADPVVDRIQSSCAPVSQPVGVVENVAKEEAPVNTDDELGDGRCEHGTPRQNPLPAKHRRFSLRYLANVLLGKR